MKKRLCGAAVLIAAAFFAATGPVRAQTTDTAPPSTPANVVASVSQYIRVSVSWKASVDDVRVTGYNVYRNGAFAGTAAGTSFSESVTPGNTYSYTVTAYDAAGYVSPPSAPSAPLSVPTDTTPPSMPQWVSVTPGTSTIKFSWSASTDNVGVAGYMLYRNGSPVSSTIGLIKQTSYTDSGLAIGNTYHYSIVAYDYAGNASNPNTTDATTVSDFTPPTVPAGLSATAKSASEIDLSWNPSFDTNGVAGYYVYRNSVQIAKVSSTFYANTGLTGGTIYLYSVAAFDPTGNTSAKTLAVQATTLAADTTAPTIPRNFAAKPVSASEIDLAWSASTDNVGVAGYYLYRGSTQIATIASSATSYADKRLATSTTYQYALRAFDVARNKSAPTTVAATTLAYTPASPVAPPAGAASASPTAGSVAPTSGSGSSKNNPAAPTSGASSPPSPSAPSAAPAASSASSAPAAFATSATGGSPAASPPEAASSTASQPSFLDRVFSGISSAWQWFVHLF